ncbi:MAG: hypothetical protein ACD_5C00094G0005 [uncultured bacterium]|nr:MAG: hypothetical protein ACD_5C00094G0005 [uncultured bacterium]
MEENKVEEKVEETKVEESIEEHSEKKQKKCLLGLCGKSCSKDACKKGGVFIAAAILVVLMAISFGYKQYRQKVNIGPEAIKAKVEKFVKDQVPETSKIEIKEAVTEGQLYKVTVSVDKQEIPVYVTRDGKKLAQAQAVIDLDGAKTNDSASQAQTPEKTEAEQKSDQPTVDLFVMSFCPYGTQIEKGMLPVVETLGNKIKFNLKFVDYAMHGQTEIDENLRQYCIQKTQQLKLDNYLKCFLKKGEGTSDACMKTAGVNVAQIKGCMTEADKQFAINETAKDKSKWDNNQFPPFNVDKEDNDKFGVQGSPTLVVNGTTISSGRDSASLLKAVCSGFTNQPKECSKQLSSTAPAPGFGEGAASTTGAAAAGAACATPQN